MQVDISAQVSVYILPLCKVSLKYRSYILSYNSLLLSFLTGHSEHNYWIDILHSSDTGK
jgi:hypothetical protein